VSECLIKKMSSYRDTSLSLYMLLRYCQGRLPWHAVSISKREAKEQWIKHRYFGRDTSWQYGVDHWRLGIAMENDRKRCKSEVDEDKHLVSG